MTSLKVIGAGLGRTGTTSLQQALEELGLGPCHHMNVAMRKQGHVVHLWKNVAEGDIDALKIILEGFTSTLDYPCCVFFEELLKWNSDGKVILSVRDSGEDWAVSVRKTIFPTERYKRFFLWAVSQFPFNNLYYLQFIFSAAWAKHGVSPLRAETNLAKMHDDWKEYVIARVPAAKLLVYNVKEGWEPLCEFLGVPVPDTPFPSSNNSASFDKDNNFKALMVRSASKAAMVAVLIAGIAVVFKFILSS